MRCIDATRKSNSNVIGVGLCVIENMGSVVIV